MLVYRRYPALGEVQRLLFQESQAQTLPGGHVTRGGRER